MGRIDEALRRTAVRDGAVAASDTPPPKHGEDVFVSPWSFEQPAEPSARPARPEPPPGPALSVTPASLAEGSAEGLALFRGFDRSIEERIVVGKGAPPILAEQFRRLAATLHHAQLVQGIKVVMVTSANPADGKTLTSTNLALTLSESYRRQVLLIDADLRRPSLHEVFGVPNVAGLNEGLMSTDEAKLCALKVTSTLTLLTAGRPEPDPMSGLTSQRMRRILEEAASRFEWVIIDTSPIGLLADASIVGGMVDGALIVVRAGQTPHAAVVKAVEAFGRERILGVVLNGAAPTSDDKLAARYYGAPAGDAGS
jgi:protein-tyrosine kinase